MILCLQTSSGFVAIYYNVVTSSLEYVSCEISLCNGRVSYVTVM